MIEPGIQLIDADATSAIGRKIAAALSRTANDSGRGCVLSLAGPLGAGKTSLCAAIIGGLGHTGPVTSPTYTLLEPYDTRPPVIHLDLYRLEAPEAWFDLGVEDLATADTVLLVEWAVRADGCLPPLDLTFQLDYAPRQQSSVETLPGRVLSVVPHTPNGRRLATMIE